MRRWNLEHPPEQDWPRVAALAVAEYEGRWHAAAARRGDERPRRDSRRRADSGRSPPRGRPTRPWPASRALLGQHGLRIEFPWSADVLKDGALELAFSVSRLSGIPLPEEDVPRDADVAPGEAGDPFQQVAAYAIVTSERGLLLTQFNDQTHIPGEWGLPGGGLDEGGPRARSSPGGVGGDRPADRARGGLVEDAVVALDRPGAERRS